MKEFKKRKRRRSP